MTTEMFDATVQYGDFMGTAAADRADNGGPNKWLEERGKKKPDEFVVGITLWAGESSDKHKDPVSVTFLLVSGSHDSVKREIESGGQPLEVRNVDVDMTLTEFHGLFKRFSISISPGGMLNGREYKYID
ncbi:MAG: hypothetical protein K2Q17_11815 [Nitrospiraceae bacterium]|jgi:hypothetical protein|uniref:hypothetical protein n=1 Tax=Nitrospira cf. moscoviensis SBR1015 TaxID=96242 RepID=UPI000A0C7B30|nr:hypothetical protein [Nitrospira cf. moscoviensis SBR1015]MBY0248343.1 hypothetical protein [Nitrospiraceae bacterium]OQW37845.1 MAG: hypothetical protein A4E20_17415 [Nitrospira sp. SG-bin2]